MNSNKKAQRYIQENIQRKCVPWVFFGAISPLILSCSPQPQGSYLQIQFPKNSLFNPSSTSPFSKTWMIQRIQAKVSGSNIEEILHSEKSCTLETSHLKCQSIELEKVPGGKNRLIQLLVVAQEIHSITPPPPSSPHSVFNSSPLLPPSGLNPHGRVDSTKIFYGYTQVDIEGDLVLNMELEELEELKNKSIISGQYIPSNGHPLNGKFLTGRIRLQLSSAIHPSPLDDKPPMEFHEFEIFSGYFQTQAYDYTGVTVRGFFTGWDESSNWIEGEEVFNEVPSMKISTQLAEALTSGTLPGPNPIYLKFSTPSHWTQKTLESPSSLNINEPFNPMYFLSPINPSVQKCVQISQPTRDFDGSQGDPKICKDPFCNQTSTWSDVLSANSVTPSCSAPGPQWILNGQKLSSPNLFYGFHGPFLLKRRSKVAHTFALPVHPALSVKQVDLFYRSESGGVPGPSGSSKDSEALDCSSMPHPEFSEPQKMNFANDEYTHTLTSEAQTELSSDGNGNFEGTLLFCPKDLNGRYYKTGLQIQKTRWKLE